MTLQTLRDIKNYYEIAFGNDVVRLFDEIENDYIEVLATFRNIKGILLAGRIRNLSIVSTEDSPNLIR